MRITQPNNTFFANENDFHLQKAVKGNNKGGKGNATKGGGGAASGGANKAGGGGGKKGLHFRLTRVPCSCYFIMFVCSFQAAKNDCRLMRAFIMCPTN